MHELLSQSIWNGWKWESLRCAEQCQRDRLAGEERGWNKSTKMQNGHQIFCTWNLQMTMYHPPTWYSAICREEERVFVLAYWYRCCCRWNDIDNMFLELEEMATCPRWVETLNGMHGMYKLYRLNDNIYISTFWHHWHCQPHRSGSESC